MRDWDEKILLVETGVGAGRAVEGVRRLLEYCAPGLLISMGFSGGLTEKLEPGDTIYGIRSAQYDVGTNVLGRACTLNSNATGTPLPPWLRPGTIVTSSAPPNKRKLMRLLPEEWNPAVVDMETAHLASIAKASVTPFISIRSVCDELGMEPNLRIERLTDEMGRVRLRKLFRYALLEPTIIIRLVRLARRASASAKAIERAVIPILEQHLSDRSFPTAHAESAPGKPNHDRH